MSLNSFIEFLDGHPDVASKVASCATYDQVAEIAKSNGFDFTGAELTKFAAEATAELSDEALEAVAGGAWTGKTSTDVAVGTAVAGGAATATSAAVSVGVAVMNVVLIK